MVRRTTLFVSFVSRRSRVESRSLNGGAPLRCPPIPRGLPHTRLAISSLLLKQGHREFPFSAASAQRLTAHRSICIHFLNFLDGSPYRAPPSNPIVWEHPRRANEPHVLGLAITGSRVMMRLRYHLEVAYTQVWRIIVWEWKTGGLVRLL